jgi:hypothetical protein
MTMDKDIRKLHAITLQLEESIACVKKSRELLTELGLHTAADAMGDIGMSLARELGDAHLVIRTMAGECDPSLD